MKRQICFQCATTKTFHNGCSDSCCHSKQCKERHHDEVVELVKSMDNELGVTVPKNIKYEQHEILYRRMSVDEIGKGCCATDCYEMDVTSMFEKFTIDVKSMIDINDEGVLYAYRNGVRQYIAINLNEVRNDILRMLDPSKKFIYKYVRGECRYGVNGEDSVKHIVNMILYVFRFRERSVLN